MKWLNGLLAALALLTPLTAQAENGTPASDTAAIEAVWDAYEVALADGDVDAEHGHDHMQHLALVFGQACDEIRDRSSESVLIAEQHVAKQLHVFVDFENPVLDPGIVGLDLPEVLQDLENFVDPVDLIAFEQMRLHNRHVLHLEFLDDVRPLIPEDHVPPGVLDGLLRLCKQEVIQGMRRIEGGL